MESDNSSLLNESMWEFPYSPANPVIAVAYILILIVALVWNLFLIVVMIRRKSVCKDPSAIFLFTLAIVDFTIAVTVTPFNAATAIAGGWIFGPTDAIRAGLCDTLAFLLNVFLSLSIHILALISFDRFLIIVYSLKYDRIMKPWTAWLLVGVICIPPILISLPPFFGLGMYHYSVFVGSCLFQWAGQRLYVALYVGEALIPIVAIVVFSIITYVYIRKFFKRQKRQASRYSLHSDKVAQRHRGRQSSLTRIFLALLVTQAICFLPGVISAFVGVIIRADNLPNAVLIISLLLIMSNAAINPIVQSIFRREMREVISCMLRPFKKCYGCYRKENISEEKNGYNTQTTQVPNSLDSSTKLEVSNGRWDIEMGSPSKVSFNE